MCAKNDIDYIKLVILIFTGGYKNITVGKGCKSQKIRLYVNDSNIDDTLEL